MTNLFITREAIASERARHIPAPPMPTQPRESRALIHVHMAWNQSIPSPTAPTTITSIAEVIAPEIPALVWANPSASLVPNVGAVEANPAGSIRSLPDGGASVRVGYAEVAVGVGSCGD